jgi:transposase-like protein
MNTETTYTPKTLIEAIAYFSNPDVALQYMIRIIWPNGPTCPHCGSQKVSFIATRRIWKCGTCPGRKQFSIKVGTVMEDSPLTLDKWLAAIWMEANSKNSISSWEVHRALGITQKSAWFMLHRIRHAIHVGSFDKKLAGVVEVDETYIGGLSQNMHKKQRKLRITSNGVAGKTAVMGLLERHNGEKHSTVRAQVVSDRRSATLHPVIHKHVEPGTQIYTDTLAGYRGLKPMYMHEFVDHAEAYVKDKVIHTNGLENFWALFKRCIKGTHVSIDPCHLEAYVDSEAFRFNHRKVKDGDRFQIALGGVGGKRLTYKALIGKTPLEGLSPSDNEEVSN